MSNPTRWDHFAIVPEGADSLTVHDDFSRADTRLGSGEWTSLPFTWGLPELAAHTGHDGGQLLLLLTCGYPGCEWEFRWDSHDKESGPQPDLNDVGSAHWSEHGGDPK